MTPAVRHAALSDIGLHRATNEDACAADEPLFVVADGMGGAQAGEVASRTAVATLVERLAAGASLAEAAGEANHRILTLARDDEERAGMGTTLTALLLGDGRGEVVHVGDSRLYRLRDERLERLTVDHSMVEQWRREGTLTAEEAASSRYRNVLTRALGTDEGIEIDHFEVDVRAGDRYLLCSDGLSALVDDEVIAGILAQGAPTVVARELVREAKNAGGHDNITVVVLRIESAAEADVEDAAGPASGGAGATGERHTGDDSDPLAAAADGGAQPAGGSVAGATPSVMKGIVEAPVAQSRSRRRRRALIAFLCLVLVALLTLAVLLATGVVEADQLPLWSSVLSEARP